MISRNTLDLVHKNIRQNFSVTYCKSAFVSAMGCVSFLAANEGIGSQL